VFLSFVLIRYNSKLIDVDLIEYFGLKECPNCLQLIIKYFMFELFIPFIMTSFYVFDVIFLYIMSADGGFGVI